MKIIKQPPNDTFTKRLFYKCCLQVKKPADFIYMWSSAIDKDGYSINDYDKEIWYRQELFNSIKNDLIILGIKDHLTAGWFNPYTEIKPNLQIYIEDLINFYPNKTFIVFTSTENLILDCSNAYVINWGGDIVNQQKEYKELEPVLEKNFDSKKHFISLNRNNRHHRTIMLSFLFGMNLNNFGNVTCLYKDSLVKSIDDLNLPKKFYITNQLKRGFNKFKNYRFEQQDNHEIYTFSPNDNVYNFNKRLRNYYQNSFVEIVTETSFTEPCYLLTEKTLNSIYGCNFPIVLCGCGSVALLREIGFDMFDDIIDHSYDSITDPVEKIFSALTSNRELLNNANYAKDLWLKNKQRFISNVAIAKERMYDFYRNRAEQQWEKLNNVYQ